MVQRTYNRFDLGVKQDNTAIFSGSPSFIDAKNLDGLKDGQGVTLGPKINKLFTSNVALRGIDAEQLGTPDNARTIVGGDNGEIYKFNSTDNTPEYTIAGQNIVQIASLGNDYIIFTKANFSSATINIYKISKSDVQSGIWTSLASALLPSALSHVGVPPVLAVGSELFIGGNGTVRKFDGSTITATETFPDDYVTGLTLQGSTIAVYTRTGNVYFWDGGATVESARGKTGARTEKAVNLNGRDFITSEDGQLKQGSYTQFGKIFNSKNSFRLEDKSQIQNKLDFSSNDDNLNHTAITALDDVYFFGNDSIKGIYKYGSLIAGTGKGIHKIITQNNAGTQIDFIYDMYFYERTDRRLYFSYKAGSTFGVDYIDLDDLESCNTGYGVTEILTGGTAFKKKLNVARISVSNVDANKTASLYYRVNNQDWVLLRTINSTTEDIYYRENITKEADGSPFKQFIDIQFKIELNSTTNDNKPPMLNELLLDYTIIEA